MKKMRLITVMMISALLTACGSKDVSTPTTEVETTIQAVETTAVKKEEIPAVEIKKEAKPIESEGVYEDNFEVETSDAMAFAEKIKVAVAAKDIEALADLTAFPVYVGIVEDGVKTREAFIALGAETVFTPELMESVEGADISEFSPSMAGFSVSKEGKSNIIFGVVDGRLAISGINYE